MKKHIICLFLVLYGFQSFSQKIHLILVSDHETNEVGMISKANEDKIYNIFNRVKEDLGYDLELIPFENNDFNAESIMKILDNTKRKSENDIVIFYYSGLGNFSSNPTQKFPILTFKKGSNNALPLIEITKKLNTKGIRLGLVFADCITSNPTQSLQSSKKAFLQISNDLEGLLKEINLFEQDLFDTPNLSYPGYYLNTLDSLNYLSKVINVKLMRNFDSLNVSKNTHFVKILKDLYIAHERIDLQYKRLLAYSNQQSPFSVNSYKNMWCWCIENQAFSSDLQYDLNNEKKLYKQNITYTIDSLYKKKKILTQTEPLNILIDSLIKKSIYKDIDVSMKTLIDSLIVEYNNNKNIDNQTGYAMGQTQNYTPRISQNLFLNSCGIYTVASTYIPISSKQNNQKSLADLLGNNFQILTKTIGFSQVDKVNISKFLNVQTEYSFVRYIQDSIKCNPNIKSLLAEKSSQFKNILESKDISHLLLLVASTKNIEQKKQLITQIKQAFATNAVINVNMNNLNNISSFAKTAPKKFTVDEYLKRLIDGKVKINSLDVPIWSLNRSKDYSKVLNIVVEEK